jgi:Spy/CpxP family protein refolding chaperone
MKTWLVLFAVFVLGCATGIGVDGIYRAKTSASRESRPRDRAVLFEKMRRDLNLSDDQAKQMHQVLDETANDFRVLRGELKPKYEALRAKARGRMRALLTPEQQQKFDAILAEIDARRQSNENYGH